MLIASRHVSLRPEVPCYGEAQFYPILRCLLPVHVELSMEKECSYTVHTVDVPNA